jgi:hypothetical protein
VDATTWEDVRVTANLLQSRRSQPSSLRDGAEVATASLPKADAQPTNLSRGNPTRDLIGENHLVGKIAKVFCAYGKASSAGELCQPRPRMFIVVLVVIWKYGVQHDSRDDFLRLVGRYVFATCGARRTRPDRAPRTEREPAVLVQHHTPPVVKHDELSDREARGVRLSGRLRSEIADGAHPYDPSWLNRRAIRVISHALRMRLPASGNAIISDALIFGRWNSHDLRHRARSGRCCHDGTLPRKVIWS